MRAILGETEAVWGAYFRGLGKTYIRPKLVLFSGQVGSACGFAEAPAGPFTVRETRRSTSICPFIASWPRRFGAPGDFARAYCDCTRSRTPCAVPSLSDKAEQAERRAGRAGANQVSVLVELQAGIVFAGVWARKPMGPQILEPGDLEQGPAAASSVGDDTLQRREQGTVVGQLYAWHSAQRVVGFGAA